MSDRPNILLITTDQLLPGGAAPTALRASPAGFVGLRCRQRQRAGIAARSYAATSPRRQALLKRPTFLCEISHV